MDTRTREEKNLEIFTLNPGVSFIYVTSDDKAFFDENKAESNAGSLSDTMIERYKRPTGEAIEALDKDVLESLKKEYKEKSGKPAHHTWDVTTIQEKLNALETSEPEQPEDNATEDDLEPGESEQDDSDKD
ncbi:MAG: hypothetical protein AAGA66_08350 [Bacteroidota bacterium]